MNSVTNSARWEIAQGNQLIRAGLRQAAARVQTAKAMARMSGMVLFGALAMLLVRKGFRVWRYDR